MAQGYQPRWVTARALALTIAVFSTPALADWLIEGRVIALSDGDTITILGGAKVHHKVRFAGIDAAERRTDG